MSVILDTIEDVKSQADRHEAVLVALSFGKDSLVVADLCVKNFKRVEAFCMSYVVDLDLTKRWLQFARDRWGLEVKEIEHWGAVRNRARGQWCFPQDIEGKLPNLASTIAAQKDVFGVKLCATGTRAAESLGRRAGLMRQQRGEKAGAWAGDWHPIAWWRRENVVAYLKQNNLPLDDCDKDMQGWSNDRASILRLHDEHPADYVKWRERFPLVEAVVRHRGWYGKSA